MAGIIKRERFSFGGIGILTGSADVTDRADKHRVALGEQSPKAPTDPCCGHYRTRLLETLINVKKVLLEAKKGIAIAGSAKNERALTCCRARRNV